jgi:hypothetical protein
MLAFIPASNAERFLPVIPVFPTLKAEENTDDEVHCIYEKMLLNGHDNHLRKLI